MSAWISPFGTTRLKPWRISVPSTSTVKPLISSSAAMVVLRPLCDAFRDGLSASVPGNRRVVELLVQVDPDAAVVDLGGIHRDRLHRWQRQGRAGGEVERGAVQSAFHLTGGGVLPRGHPALVQRVVLVAAGVVDRGHHVLVDAHQAHRLREVDEQGLTHPHGVEVGHALEGHQRRPPAWAITAGPRSMEDSMRCSTVAVTPGRSMRSVTSAKKPKTSSRMASWRGMPRDSR